MKNNNKKFSTTFPEDGLKSIRENAKRSNLKINRYLIALDQNHKFRVEPNILTDEFVSQLLRVGRNLNQITHKINAGQLTEVNFERLLKAVCKLHLDINEARKGDSSE